MLQLKIILGSTRPNRFSEKIAPWVADVAQKHGNFDVEVLDLRDYPLPFYDQPTSPSQIKDGDYANPIAKNWAKKIADADAFLVITPEYNHGPSAVLKNALDSIYAEWNRKAITFISYGNVGGARSVEQLRLIAVELQMAPVRAALHLFSFRTLLDEQGVLKESAIEPYTKPLQDMLEQLSWWGEALKAARASEKK